MGLDNYWIMPGQNPHPDFNPPLNLCSGLFSGHGKESFRGKVYATFCLEVMGLDLYSESIASDDLLKGVAKLKQWMENNSTYNDINEEEISDLYKMFFTYANLGATLESWF